VIGQYFGVKISAIKIRNAFKPLWLLTEQEDIVSGLRVTVFSKIGSAIGSRKPTLFIYRLSFLWR